MVLLYFKIVVIVISIAITGWSLVKGKELKDVINRKWFKWIVIISLLFYAGIEVSSIVEEHLSSDKQNKNIENQLQQTDSLKQLNFKITQQLKDIETTNTKLYQKQDSLVSNLDSLNVISDRLFKEALINKRLYNRLNLQLEKQVEQNDLIFFDSRPKMMIYNSEIHFKQPDSSQALLSLFIPLKNMGGREADSLVFSCVALYFDSTDSFIDHGFNSLNLESLFLPNTTFESVSAPIKETIHEKTKTIILLITCNYYDPLLSKHEEIAFKFRSHPYDKDRFIIYKPEDFAIDRNYINFCLASVKAPEEFILMR